MGSNGPGQLYLAAVLNITSAGRRRRDVAPAPAPAVNKASNVPAKSGVLMGTSPRSGISGGVDGEDDLPLASFSIRRDNDDIEPPSNSN